MCKIHVPAKNMREKKNLRSSKGKSHSTEENSNTNEHNFANKIQTRASSHITENSSNLSMPKFLCPKCGKKFPFHGDFLRHSLICKNVKCLHCDQTFISTKSRASHLKHCLAKKAMVSSIEKISPENPREVQQKADKPSKIVKRSKVQMNSSNTITSKPFECNNCSKRFAWIESFNKHSKRCFKPSQDDYECGSCDKKFESLWHLFDHNESAHGLDCFESCHDCDSKFTSELNLRLHQEASHMKPQNPKDPVKNFVFVSFEPENTPEVPEVTEQSPKPFPYMKDNSDKKHHHNLRCMNCTFSCDDYEEMQNHCLLCNDVDIPVVFQ